jgi:hypothetical protein
MSFVSCLLCSNILLGRLKVFIVRVYLLFIEFSKMAFITSLCVMEEGDLACETAKLDFSLGY